MLDHAAIRVADFEASERFYRTTLGALGIEPTDSGNGWLRWRDLLIAAADPGQSPTRHLHVGFVAPSRQRVDEFWRAGREAGYEDAGAPGERPQYTPAYYGAFLRDPDGNSVEAVHHADVRHGGNIDHLWIRVPDLGAESAFYEAIMRHAGLREGRRWEEGRQFRGAWATLSLVEDGQPVTEHLHLAFPALDRDTIDDFRRAAGDAGSPGCFSPGGTSVASVLRETS
jgi:catechol 2,3-dioxygenase-like lactoylglutathione lyase family enzyme